MPLKQTEVLRLWVILLPTGEMDIGGEQKSVGQPAPPPLQPACPRFVAKQYGEHDHNKHNGVGPVPRKGFYSKYRDPIFFLAHYET